MTLCWSQRENFSGRLQQLVINGERILDEAHLKQLHYEGDDDNDDDDDDDDNNDDDDGASDADDDDDDDDDWLRSIW